MEEERRLCYVGMTRAQEKLYMIASRSRQFQGVRNENKPSRFLLDIPRELIDAQASEASGYRPAYRTRKPEQYSSPGREGPAASAPSRRSKSPQPSSTTEFAIGSKVQHPVFGPGVVAAAEGSGKDAKLVIIFRDRGRKKIALQYASLTRG